MRRRSFARCARYRSRKADCASMACPRRCRARRPRIAACNRTRACRRCRYARIRAERGCAWMGRPLWPWPPVRCDVSARADDDDNEGDDGDDASAPACGLVLGGVTGAFRRGCKSALWCGTALIGARGGRCRTGREWWPVSMRDRTCSQLSERFASNSPCGLTPCMPFQTIRGIAPGRSRWASVTPR